MVRDVAHIGKIPIIFLFLSYIQFGGMIHSIFFAPPASKATDNRNNFNIINHMMVVVRTGGPKS